MKIHRSLVAFLCCLALLAAIPVAADTSDRTIWLSDTIDGHLTIVVSCNTGLHHQQFQENDVIGAVNWLNQVCPPETIE